MRELASYEIDCVAGGWVCPPPDIPGNPGNFKPVGNAGETPSGNPNFITGGSVDPNNSQNGRAGNSAQ
jgi:hypothetical protein